MLEKVKSYLLANKAISIKVAGVVVFLSMFAFSVSWIKDIYHKKQLQRQQEQIQQLESKLSASLRERDQLKKETDSKIADFEIKLKIANNAHAAAQDIINHRPPKPGTDSTITTTVAIPEECKELLTNQYNTFIAREEILIADIDSSRTALEAATKAVEAAKVQLALDEKIISDGTTLAITQKDTIIKLKDSLTVETSRKEKWRLGAIITGSALILVLVL